MGSFIDITGNKYGRLTVLYRNGRNSCGKIVWHCKCECGNETDVITSVLKSGQSKSCGCYSLECSRKRMTKHGMSETRVYKIWKDMIQRCTNKNNKNYEDYGGRGIKVCDEWLDFLNFYEWATINGYEDGLTLDRINTDNSYCPENCRWVDMFVQANNKRTTVMIEAAGITRSLHNWARIVGINPMTLYNRIELGFSPEEALFTPVGCDRNMCSKLIEFNKELHTIDVWSKILGINKATLKYRLKNGWSVERALTTPVDVTKRRKEVRV